MLVLKDIKKNYDVADTQVQALKGINIEFRKSEFVSILGQSGCGKTTLLNIIGGLDRYTSGDLSVNGTTTKEFSNSDWDSYRNRSIGFVFQNYNLIPHQTVVSNVELALTLSGVSKSERRRRAIDVLTKVGLGDQINKKPNQMSGGQMQRVAIARALINDPEILLADEPTGALDSETSVQIMEILKEIAKDRLIIMVTHNPEIAQNYSTRIIRLLDGNVISDSNPYTAETQKPVAKGKKGKYAKRTTMSFGTALALSLNNLLTKKTRTFLTAFAGSIGIIGIALIMSLSSGMQAHITRVEEETLSSYPLQVEKTSVDIGSLISASTENRRDDTEHDLDKIYSNDVMSKMINTMLAEINTNDLKTFKAYLDSPESGVSELVNDIQYGYNTVMNIYKADTSNGIIQVNPNTLFDSVNMGQGSQSPMMGMSMMTGMDVWQELLNNDALNATQFDIIAGSLPKNYNEVVLIVDKENEITDFSLYSLGIKSQEEFEAIMKDVMTGKATEPQPVSYTYDEIMDITFKLILNTDYYEKVNDLWVDKRSDNAYMKTVVDNGIELKIVGIVRPSGDSIMESGGGSIGYTSDLTSYLVDKVNASAPAIAQKENPEIDIFTGKPFATEENASTESEFDMSAMTPEQQAYVASLSPEELETLKQSYAPNSKATYDENITKLGLTELDNPSSIRIYPKDFMSKDALTKNIADYNQRMNDEGKEENVIHYTDYVGLMMSSVSDIINAISYVLIAFVAISLVVSSIMIGIITYISVLERTKEIGILRSIGASKGDISRVFNAETLIVGFVSGALGIIVTLILCIPANIIIESVSGIANVAALPAIGGAALILISMMLTFIAGLIPSKIAANKDPVVALRTE